MEQFNGGDWHCGRIPGTIVSNTVSGDAPRNADNVRHWGGYLIAENVAPSNLTVLTLAKELFRVLKTFTSVGPKPFAFEEAEELIKKIEGR